MRAAQQHKTGQGGRRAGRGGRRADIGGESRGLRRAGGWRSGEGDLDERASGGRGGRASERVREVAGQHCCCSVSFLASRYIKCDKKIVIKYYPRIMYLVNTLRRLCTVTYIPYEVILLNSRDFKDLPTILTNIESLR